MPREILVKPEAGQEVVVNPVGGLKIAKGDGSHPDPWKHGGGGNMDFSANIEDSSLKASDLAVVL